MGKEKKDLIKFLQKTHLFQGLSTMEAKFLNEYLHLRKYQAGEPIFHEGESGCGAYVIVSGGVEILLSAPLSSASESQRPISLGVGQLMGEMALIEDKGRRTVKARAVGNTELLVLFQSDLVEITKKKPAIGAKIYAQLATIFLARLNQVGSAKERV